METMGNNQGQCGFVDFDRWHSDVMFGQVHQVTTPGGVEIAVYDCRLVKKSHRTAEFLTIHLTTKSHHSH